MPCNCGRPRPVEPELASRLGTDSYEAFAITRIGNTHHLRGGSTDAIVIVANDIGQQHHFRPSASARLGSVSDCAQVTFVKVLESRQRGGLISFKI